jgi:hypothetical protein
VVSLDRRCALGSASWMDVGAVPGCVCAAEGRADVCCWNKRQNSRAHARPYASGRFEAGDPLCQGAGTGGRGVRRSRSLAGLHPELLSELHPALNGELDPYRIGARSGRKLWWRCAACGHAWDAAPHDRSVGGGCPRCARAKRNAANRGVDRERSLALKRPDLLAELHPSRNGQLDPYALGAGSGQQVWWRCGQCGLEWRETRRAGRVVAGAQPAAGDGQRRRRALSTGTSPRIARWRASARRSPWSCTPLAMGTSTRRRLPRIPTATCGGCARPAGMSGSNPRTRGEQPADAQPAGAACRTSSAFRRLTDRRAFTAGEALAVRQ